MPENSVLMKKLKGTTAYCESKCRGIVDSKIVSLLSTFIAVVLVVKVNRWFDRKKE